MHEANRKWWDAKSPDCIKQETPHWQQYLKNPGWVFQGKTLEVIREYIDNLEGKRACVIGSGDNLSSFTLAGFGMKVTSTDISKPRLDSAAKRAAILGYDIEFLQCDASDMSPLSSDVFDLVCSTNGFFIWLSDLLTVFKEVYRITRPGGYYIFFDIHPFLRPFKDLGDIEVKKSYFDTGPFSNEDLGNTTYNYHWTLSDLLNPLADSGFIIRKVTENPSERPGFWDTYGYDWGDDESLLDWHVNPMAALPVWLTVAAQKPS